MSSHTFFSNTETILILRDTILDNQFKITEKLSEGTFGIVYSGINLKKLVGSNFEPIIVKFTLEHTISDQEFKAIREIKEQ